MRRCQDRGGGVLNISIQPASNEDLDEIYRLELECFGEDAYPRFLLKYLLDNRDSIFLKASIDNLLVGFIAGLCSGDSCTLYTIDVKKEFRRRGVGSMLLEAFEKRALEKNVKKIILQVEVSNTPAINLYLKKGYKITRRIRNYYGLGRDAYEACKTIWVGENISKSSIIFYRDDFEDR